MAIMLWQLIRFGLLWSIGLYSGCQKNVPIFKRFFYNRTPVYAAIPQLRNFEHYYEKRYKIKLRLLTIITI